MCNTNIKNWPKTAKKATIAFKAGGFCVWGVRTVIFGLKVARRVYYIPSKQSASYLQYFWKNHFSNIGKKSIFFFQLFPHFHKDFSKDLLSNLVKSTCFVVGYSIPQWLKMCDMINKFRRKNYVVDVWSTISQHLFIPENEKIDLYTKLCEIMM